MWAAEAILALCLDVYRFSCYVRCMSRRVFDPRRVLLAGVLIGTASAGVMSPPFLSFRSCTLRFCLQAAAGVDVWAHGLWSWNWADSHRPVTAINPSNEIRKHMGPTTLYQMPPSRSALWRRDRHACCTPREILGMAA